MRSLGFLLVLLSSFPLLSQQYQQIEGHVTDDQTNQVLPFCSVYLGHHSIGTISNANGEFDFHIPTGISDTLIISHVGYQDFKIILEDVSTPLSVRLEEATIDLQEISIEAKALSGNEVLSLALETIQNHSYYTSHPFRMDAFYRELNTANKERVATVEAAVEIYGESVTKKQNEAIISQFRKAFDKSQKENLNDWTAGKNHLYLLLNSGINVVPLAKGHKKSIWGKRNFTIERVSFYHDRPVYILSDNPQGNELRIIIDAEDYKVYKSELIMRADESDHDEYLWPDVNVKGQKCGAILDHQSYEYREVNGKMYPFYFFRKQDFRCYDLSKDSVVSQSYLSKELLVNDVRDQHLKARSADKLKMRRGMIKYNEPYDTAFWQHFNDIKEIDRNSQLQEEQTMISSTQAIPAMVNKINHDERIFRTGDHDKRHFNAADTLFGALSPDLSCYDVHHYDLAIEVFPETSSIEGTCTISFGIETSTQTIRLDLQEHLNITRVEKDGQQLDFRRYLDAVYVDFDDTLQAGTLHKLSVTYRGSPWEFDINTKQGAFHWSRDENNLPFIQSICQGYGPKGWWPVKNHLSDEPESVSLQITVPEHLVAVANGTLQAIDSDGGKNTYQWQVTNPINNYGIAAHIGDYASHMFDYGSEYGEPFPVSYYYLKGDSAFAQKRLQNVPKMIKVFEKYFGPYPFSEDGFKVVQSVYPMEHQSCVAGGQLLDEKEILHEIAHEWWGNSVSVSDNADIWIHEAFATYSESLYIEETLGYDVAQAYLNVKKSDIFNDHPLVGVKGVNHVYYRIEDKYFKGALMLNTLRQIVQDDELWFATLRDIQTDFRHSMIDTESLIQYFNEKLHQDLTPYFNQYLYTVQIPLLEIRTQQEQSEMKWTQVVEEFEMELKVGETSLYPSRQWQPLPVLSDEQIAQLESDYLIKVLR